jgi:TetR/AcrR family transcriptional repressor of nem operon
MASERIANTAERILDVAEHLVQVRGFNAFSYADVSKAVGIQKASLHHHFATKTDLGVALIDRYKQVFLAALDAIESSDDKAVERIERYVELYRTVLRRGRMCMCGMLAADVETLPEPMRERVAGFFAENEAWLTRILSAGKERGELQYTGSTPAMAAFLVSSLEGAMLISRGRGDLEHLDAVAELLLANLRPTPAIPNSVRTKSAGMQRRKLKESA